MEIKNHQNLNPFLKVPFGFRDRVRSAPLVWVAVRKKVIGPGLPPGLTCFSATEFSMTFGAMAPPYGGKRVLFGRL